METQVGMSEEKRRRLGSIPRIGDTVKFLHNVDHGPNVPVRFERAVSDATVTRVYLDLQHVDVEVSRASLGMPEIAETSTAQFTRVRRDNDLKELDSWHLLRRFA